MLSLDDAVLPSTFLKLCIDSYDPESYGETCHHLSPSLCPDEVLKRFPPTRLMIAGNDPLRDESYRLALRLV